MSTHWCVSVRPVNQKQKLSPTLLTSLSQPCCLLTLGSVAFLTQKPHLYDFLPCQHEWLLKYLCFHLYFSCSALLIKAHSMPFQVQPSTMAGVVKGLYSLRPGEPCCYYLFFCCQKAFVCKLHYTFHRFIWFPFSEWAQLAPALFSGFIPQINPPALESLLSDYAAHDQKLQMELSMKGFPRSVFWGFTVRHTIWI